MKRTGINRRRLVVFMGSFGSPTLASGDKHSKDFSNYGDFADNYIEGNLQFLSKHCRVIQSWF